MKFIDEKVYVYGGKRYGTANETGKSFEELKSGTIAAGILDRHNQGKDSGLYQLKFDSLASHDITYVGIIQTAKASGLSSFPVPYVLTNCHNSLCAVGGTLNEDDHVFGLSAAQKYGGIYVPANVAVIHQYIREMMAFSGGMILGSDSHTRYGTLGCMGVGEGGPELVKQILSCTYDVPRPGIVAIWLEGKVRQGVGPQDVALAIIKAVYAKGLVKNKVMEFIGPGVSGLSVDFRNGVDVMTTETTCLSSVWRTDSKVEEFYALHGRADAYRQLDPADEAAYDGMLVVDLSEIEPMIALPFHPSNAYTIRELNENPYEILKEAEERCQAQLENNGVTIRLTDKIVDGKIKVDQGVIAGCSGGIYENVVAAADILKGRTVTSNYFALSVYPSSQPIYLELIKNGCAADLMEAGAILKPAFCGPCFGAGDTPANEGLSIRHTTRNFPSREGSKPGAGQISSVALMDARSIAATAASGGFLTPATELAYEASSRPYYFNSAPYDKLVYNGAGRPQPEAELRYGPNIADWPSMIPMTDNMLMKIATVIRDPVTTTDELIPSGETSSYRSNPLKLAEFTLSRKDPEYVGRAKAVYAAECARREGQPLPEDMQAVLRENGVSEKDTSVGSCVFAMSPGDGSAREQAASCQRVLGGNANICYEYATKRYRSNLINWGIVPFTLDEGTEFPLKRDDYLLVKGLRKAIEEGRETIEGIFSGSASGTLTLNLPKLTEDEREILLKGCLINYYADKNK